LRKAPFVIRKELRCNITSASKRGVTFLRITSGRSKYRAAIGRIELSFPYRVPAIRSNGALLEDDVPGAFKDLREIAGVELAIFAVPERSDRSSNHGRKGKSPRQGGVFYVVVLNVTPIILGRDDHFPKEEVVPLTGALLYDLSRAGFQLHAVEDANDITAILGAGTDTTVVDEEFNSVGYLAFIPGTADDRLAGGDEISGIDRKCSFATAILNLPSDNADSTAVLINDFYGHSVDEGDVEIC
jgi:hypothetical protein